MANADLGYLPRQKRVCLLSLTHVLIYQKRNRNWKVFLIAFGARRVINVDTSAAFRLEAHCLFLALASVESLQAGVGVPAGRRHLLDGRLPLSSGSTDKLVQRWEARRRSLSPARLS